MSTDLRTSEPLKPRRLEPDVRGGVVRSAPIPPGIASSGPFSRVSDPPRTLPGEAQSTLQRIVALCDPDAYAVLVPTSLLLRVGTELALVQAHEATDHLCRDCGRASGATTYQERLLCGACALDRWTA